jgi:hypothetical protein
MCGARQFNAGKAVRWVTVTLISACIGATFVVIPATSAAALDASDFKPGDIISDVVMYAKDTMSAASIQAFLDEKMPSCDPGFTCLKDYHQNTTDYDVPVGSTYTQHVCAPYKGAQNESAATIIYKVSQDCGVNPQVILVILEKEQDFVTNPDPTSLTYRKAMGYGCPDTAKCSSDFYGFFKQVFWGARAMDRPVSNYRVGVAAIHYSPDAACGTKTVTITDKATANLYTYTPYTPNRASLAAIGTDTAVTCGSYGNRNFWYYFSIWFGSTNLPQADLAFVEATYKDLLGRNASNTDQDTQANYLIRHPSRAGFAVRVQDGTEYRTRLITELYQTIMGSTPSASTISATLAAVETDRVPQDDLVPWILSSAAFYAKIGGTQTPWITAMYEYTLGRMPTVAESAHQREALLAGASKLTLAERLWHSTESNTREANDIYLTYLDRAPTSSELGALVSYLDTHSGAGGIGEIMGKSEYLSDAMLRFPIPSS